GSACPRLRAGAEDSCFCQQKAATNWSRNPCLEDDGMKCAQTPSPRKAGSPYRAGRCGEQSTTSCLPSTVISIIPGAGALPDVPQTLPSDLWDGRKGTNGEGQPAGRRRLKLAHFERHTCWAKSH